MSASIDFKLFPFQFSNFFLSLLGKFNGYLSLKLESQESSSHCQCSPAASSRFPAMPNAEEEKRRKEKEMSTLLHLKNWKCMLPSPVSPFSFPYPSHPFPSSFSRFPISLALFSLSRYTPESSSHPFPLLLRINEINNIYKIKIFVFLQ